MIKRINEEQEDNLDVMPIDFGNFSSVAKKGSSDFYIVYVRDFMDEMGLEYREAEDLLDQEFGSGNWGDTESFSVCDSCGDAIYLDDYYESDYYFHDNGGIFCGECVRGNPDDYIDQLINDASKANKLVDEEVIKERGFSPFYVDYEYKRYTTQRELLRALLTDYPSGEFIFTGNDVDDILARNVEEETLEEDKQGKERFIELFGKELSDKFFQLKPRLSSPFNDISYWMTKKPEELSLKLSEIEKTPTVKQKQDLARQGSKLLYEDEEWNVREITTLEASIKYGKETKWCISGTDCNPKEMWDYYMGGKLAPKFNKKTSLFIFFTNKITQSKWAVLLDKKTKEHLIWNELDNSTSFIEGAPRVKGLPNFSKIPFKLKHELSKPLKVKVDRIIEIKETVKEVYPDDHLEKYMVTYRDDSGKSLQVYLFRRPDTEQFAKF
jgi:hypothetical protein